jgi:hypothetical protein
MVLKAATISSVPNTYPNLIPAKPCAFDKVTDKKTCEYFFIKGAFEKISG